MAAPNESPELTVVEGAAPPPATDAPQPAAAEEAPSERRRGVPIWVLAVVILIALVLVGWQYQRAELLAGHVGALEVELAEAGAKLTSYQRHLTGVRSGIESLVGQAVVLRDLANSDPLAAPPEAPPAPAAKSESPPPAEAVVAPPAEPQETQAAEARADDPMDLLLDEASPLPEPLPEPIRGTTARDRALPAYDWQRSGAATR